MNKINNVDKKLAFDQDSALALNKARMDFLSNFLPYLKEDLRIKTVLDCGCGVGHFSYFLLKEGLEVTAFDVRGDNIKEAKERYPQIKFLVGNIEDVNFMNSIGKYDLVLCFGLLYHLENPFLAIRNLNLVCKKIVLIETMYYPSGQPVALFVKEEIVEDQGLNYCALVPSVNLFYLTFKEAKFNFIYLLEDNVLKHRDYQSSFIRKSARKIFLLSCEKVNLNRFYFNEINVSYNKPFFCFYRFPFNYLINLFYKIYKKYAIFQKIKKIFQIKK